jgi:hypothetical protein
VPLTIYVDESKARGFRFAGAVVPTRDAARCRVVMASLRTGPTHRIHFKKERDSTRKAVLSAIEQLPIDHVLVEVIPRSGPAPPREKGLIALAQFARSVGADALVLERDPSNAERDRRVLFDALGRRVNEKPTTYHHVAATEEPLLWIPDAVAWSWTRGGEWRKRVKGLRLQVIRV